ncbi:DUF3857 domain-containing transglutaminase family protein [Sphingomicrobium sp. XHP0235]|uniref:DUF3857 domain-containing transglutaminase family protein n=1 Tax=Sphingomicrobium aquimarinum TaxID=3133971 RepID=UPI0031FED2C7
MVLRTFLALAAASTSFASIAVAQEVQRQSAPEWVIDRTIERPEEDTGAAADLFLLDTQTRVDADTTEVFLKMVARPNNRSGLQQVGAFHFPWVSARGPAFLHALTIHRGDEVIDRLADADIRVVDQQQQLASSTIDGTKAVMVLVPGLQVGDEIHIAYGFRMQKDLFGLPPEQLYVKLGMDVPAAIFQRLVADEKDGLRVRFTPQYGEPERKKTRFGTAYDVRLDRLDSDGSIKIDVDGDAEDAEADTKDYPLYAPPEETVAFFQASPYPDWSAAAMAMQPFYADVTKIDPDGELAALADRIMAEHATPEARMMEALRVVQEDVRYIAILLGQGAYTPTPPEQAYRDRAADCKASTAILMALLERMGIRNDALLVRSSEGAILSRSLPSLALFDHVITRAHVNGRTYYLDGTGFGQVTPADVSGAEFGYGLPLVANASLVSIPHPVQSAPSQTLAIEWDGSDGISGEVPFTAMMELSGSHAAAMRVVLDQAGSRESRDTMLKTILPSIANDDIETVELVDRDAQGRLTIRYAGAAWAGWRAADEDEDEDADSEDPDTVPADNENDEDDAYRWSLAVDSTEWDVDFDREEGPYRDMDVMLGAPFWTVATETFKLPSEPSGDFAVRVADFDERLAGTRLVRTVTQGEDRITVRTEMKRDVDRIGAEEARSAQERLDEIAEEELYLFAPAGFEPEEAPEDGEELTPPPIVRTSPR